LIGAVPACNAKLASALNRWAPAVRPIRIAAVSGPQPTSASSCGRCRLTSLVCHDKRGRTLPLERGSRLELLRSSLARMVLPQQMNFPRLALPPRAPAQTLHVGWGGSEPAWLLSQGMTARSRQPLSRGFVPAPSRRVAKGRTGPSRETCRCAPSTISPGHRCVQYRETAWLACAGNTSRSHKLTPFCHFTAVASRADTRLGSLQAHHVGSKTWLSVCRGIACTVAAV
jgi:hypothetical protein